MKIAVLGGSFNPFHNGHAMLAESVIKELDYDKVLFVPAFLPPHKTMNLMTDAQVRLKMLMLFCERQAVLNKGRRFFEVEPCEIERGGISYSVDTISYICKKYHKELDGGKPAFIMGDEVAAEFDKWKEPARIAEMVDFIIASRYPVYEVAEKNEKVSNSPRGNYCGDFKSSFVPEKFGYPFMHLKSPVLPVSSSDIRGRLLENLSWRYLVPECIAEYIETNNLYRPEM